MSRLRDAIGERGQHQRHQLQPHRAAHRRRRRAKPTRRWPSRPCARIDNVQSVVNELTVGLPRSIGGRSNDASSTSKVKASFIDAKDLFANSLKVVTVARRRLPDGARDRARGRPRGRGRARRRAACRRWCGCSRSSPRRSSRSRRRRSLRARRRSAPTSGRLPAAQKRAADASARATLRSRLTAGFSRA